jgi:hypothetical protein
MPEHVHVHAPHELSEPGEAVTGRERILEIAAALVMSLATLGIAWSGYQAARWSGSQSEHYTEASAARSVANREASLVNEQRIQDVTTFDRWLEQTVAGNAELAALSERQFRDEFRPAFAAWLAQDPFHRADAIPTPWRMPEYRLELAERGDRLEAHAAVEFAAGKEATKHADAYVFATVFFAAVLFFAGMSLRFAWFRMRVIVLGIGVVLLGYGIVRVAGLPNY